MNRRDSLKSILLGLFAPLLSLRKRESPKTLVLGETSAPADWLKGTQQHDNHIAYPQWSVWIYECMNADPCAAMQSLHEFMGKTYPNVNYTAYVRKLHAFAEGSMCCRVTVKVLR